MTVHVDQTTYQQFEKVCETIGVSPSSVLNTFVKNVVEHNDIPFHVETHKKAVRPPFQFGCLAGKIWTPEDFNTPLEEFEDEKDSGVLPIDPAVSPEKKAVRPPLEYGCLAGQIWMAEDFDAPLDDFKEYME